MNDNKPIKRNPAIVEFSKDHHFALLLIWKIREGLKKSIEPARIIQYAVHFFDTDLIAHFKEEEELLFNRLPENDQLRIRAEQEHVQIRKMVEDLRKNKEDKNLLVDFSDTLEKHIRFEERVLFNHLQENLSNDELQDIAVSLRSRKHPPGEVYNDAFWTNKKKE